MVSRDDRSVLIVNSSVTNVDMSCSVIYQREHLKKYTRHHHHVTKRQVLISTEGYGRIKDIEKRPQDRDRNRVVEAPGCNTPLAPLERPPGNLKL